MSSSQLLKKKGKTNFEAKPREYLDNDIIVHRDIYIHIRNDRSK